MPALDTDGFRRQLQSGKVARVYLFHGDDVRLIEQLVDALEATVDEADRPFAVERVYAGEAGGSPVDIVAAASVLPMLGDRRIVTVLRSERFLKPARKGTASDDAGDAPEGDDAPGAVDTSAIEAYLDNPSPSGVLVFVASGNGTRKNFVMGRSACAIVKTTFVEMSPPRPSPAPTAIL
jgi:hypothetical protein